MDNKALDTIKGTIPPYPAQNTQIEAQAIQQFAMDNGYSYQLSAPQLVQYSWKDYRSTPAWLGLTGIGARKDAFNVVSGQYLGYQFTMFLMWDHMVDGSMYRNPTDAQVQKFTQQQTTGIVRVTLPKIFPQIVLDSNINDRFRSSIGTSYLNSQKLQLEGDFANYFDLYAPSGIQINVLSLLAPNMMQILKNNAGLFDVEFFGSELILITKSTLYTPDTIALLNQALSEQLNYLNRLMASWNYTPRNQPFDVLEKPTVTGKSLKVGSLRISPKVQIILILCLFVVSASLLYILKRI